MKVQLFLNAGRVTKECLATCVDQTIGYVTERTNQRTHARTNARTRKGTEDKPKLSNRHIIIYFLIVYLTTLPEV